MKLISRLIFLFASNLIAMLIANHFIADFEISLEPANLFFVVGLLTLFNIFVRPALKLLLSPLIILTLGLFTFVIDGGILYVVDILSGSITINGIMPLIYTTLVISAVNLLISLSARSLYRQRVIVR